MIRQVEERDVSAILKIYNDYILNSTATFDIKPLGEIEMLERVSTISVKYPYFVFETDCKVIGYAYAHNWKEREAYEKTLETTIYIIPEYCGMGIGQKLLNKLIEECRAHGVHSLIACITAENEASIAMHRKHGFVEVSHFREVGQKFGRYIDIKDFQLILSNAKELLQHF